MTENVVCVKFNPEDIEVLQEYISLMEIKGINGKLITRNDAIYSIVKQFVDDVAKKEIDAFKYNRIKEVGSEGLQGKGKAPESVPSLQGTV